MAESSLDIHMNIFIYTPLLWSLASFGGATSYVLPVLLRAGATPNPLSLMYSRSRFVSSVFCSGVIEAERRRWRAPEKLRLIAAISYCARAATAYL